MKSNIKRYSFRRGVNHWKENSRTHGKTHGKLSKLLKTRKNSQNYHKFLKTFNKLRKTPKTLEKLTKLCENSQNSSKLPKCIKLLSFQNFWKWFTPRVSEIHNILTLWIFKRITFYTYDWVNSKILWHRPFVLFISLQRAYSDGPLSTNIIIVLIVDEIIKADQTAWRK